MCGRRAWPETRASQDQSLLGPVLHGLSQAVVKVSPRHVMSSETLLEKGPLPSSRGGTQFFVSCQTGGCSSLLAVGWSYPLFLVMETSPRGSCFIRASKQESLYKKSASTTNVTTSYNVITKVTSYLLCHNQLASSKSHAQGERITRGMNTRRPG